jgi:hypothetical protein
MRIRTVPAVALACTLLAGNGLAQYGDIGELKVNKPEDKEHVKSTPPPEGAVVLFDGKGLDGWVSRKGGKPAPWKLTDGAMQVEGGDIHTTRTFAGKFKLHVEFRVPYMPKKAGQARGNSGVYVQGRYEVQVLDSYGLKPGMGDCGAIYGVSIPRVNACKAPTVWQSYDIEFTAPKVEGGKVVEPARMTVYHNGVKIQDDVRLVTKDKAGKEVFVTNTTAGMGGDPGKPGPIMLQDHGDPVQFRNVWLLPIKE